MSAMSKRTVRRVIALMLLGLLRLMSIQGREFPYIRWGRSVGAKACKPNFCGSA